MTESNPSPADAMSTTTRDVPDWVIRIIRRHAHDLRNHLNALELDAMLLEELLDSPDAGALLDRMRANFLLLNEMVRSLMAKFEASDSVVVAAADLLQLWKYKVISFESPFQRIEWQTVSGTGSLTVNKNVVLSVLSELTLAAWKRAAGQPLRAALQVAPDGTVSIQLREPANDTPLPEDLIKESARFIAADNGRLEHRQDHATGEWITTLTYGDRPVLPGPNSRDSLEPV